MTNEEICERAELLHDQYQHLHFGADYSLFAEFLTRVMHQNNIFDQYNRCGKFFIYRVNGYTINIWFRIEHWIYVVQSDDDARYGVYVSNRRDQHHCLTSSLTEEDETMMRLML